MRTNEHLIWAGAFVTVALIICGTILGGIWITQ